MKDNNFCPLCDSESTKYYQSKYQLYHRCINCLGIFVDKNQLPDRESELLRYKQHNNNVEDKGYQDFVSPITSVILTNQTKDKIGLDFGAGTGPVISQLLSDNDFNIQLYDPLFHNNRSLLTNKYDYIACCEVIEHFHTPRKEFSLLKKLLKPNGRLYCMTNIYDDSINFQHWEYRNDFTHVFFYCNKSIYWIRKEFGFSNVNIKNRLITFSN